MSKFGEIKSEMILESRMGYVTDPDVGPRSVDALVKAAWAQGARTEEIVDYRRQAMIEFGTVHENGWLLERYVRAKQAAEAKDEWTRDLIIAGVIKVVALPSSYSFDVFPWQIEKVDDYVTIDWYEIP
jgi:hypothetical protein